MTIAAMMIHECDIVRQTITRGAAGGRVTAETTIASGLACRAVPQQPVTSTTKDDMFVSYKFYFATNPGCDTRDYVKFTGEDGQELKLWVVHVYNPHEKNKFWKVFCSSVKNSE